MKSFFTILLFATSLGGWAQSNTDKGYKLSRDEMLDIDRYNKFRQKSKPVTGKWHVPETMVSIRNEMADTADWAGSNALGQKFILPQDNMCMLKPLNEGNMPVLLPPGKPDQTPQQQAAQMPNAIRRKLVFSPSER